jgi:hypothetical protein
MTNDLCLLFRPRPIENESLSSYIQRIAVANITSPNSIFKLFLQENKKLYPKISYSCLLDIYPASTLNVKLFENMLKIERNEFKKMSFLPVFRNFSIEESKMPRSRPRSRLLSGMIEIHRKYCPKCLSEHNYYKLIWQVKEKAYCKIHGIKFEDKCWSCKKRIPMIPAAGIIGICPYCFCGT